MDKSLAKQKIDECKLKADNLSNNISKINKKAINYVTSVERNPDGSIPISEPFRKNMLNYLDEQTSTLNSIGETIEELSIIYNRNHPVNVAKRKQEHEKELLQFHKDCDSITDSQYFNWVNKQIPWYKKIFKKIELTKLTTYDESLRLNVFFRLGDDIEQKFTAEKWQIEEIRNS